MDCAPADARVILARFRETGEMTPTHRHYEDDGNGGRTWHDFVGYYCGRRVLDAQAYEGDE